MHGIVLIDSNNKYWKTNSFVSFLDSAIKNVNADYYNGIRINPPSQLYCGSGCSSFSLPCIDYIAYYITSCRDSLCKKCEYPRIALLLISFIMAETSKNQNAERNKRRKERWASIIGLFAVVFLWRAVWDWSELYFTSNGSFVIGIALVGIVGWLHKEHVKELF